MEHRRGLFFMIFWMGYSVVFSFLISLFIPREIINSLWFIIFYQVGIFLLPLAIWLAIFREKINSHLPHMRLGKMNIIYIIGLSLTIQPVMMLIGFITNVIAPNEVPVMLDEFGAVYPVLFIILVIGITPAICEEVVFRGYIQSTYKNKPFWTMALINGLFFGIMHRNLHQFSYAFAVGILFAYMVYATRSIRAAVISHFVINASQVSLFFLLNALLVLMERLSEWLEGISEAYGLEMITEAIAATDEIDFSSAEGIIAVLMLLGIVAGAAVGSAFLLRGFHRHNKQRMAEYEAKLLAGEIEEVTAGVAPMLPAEAPGEVFGEPAPDPRVKRKNMIIDGLLILAVVVMYVLLLLAFSGDGYNDYNGYNGD